ncbi:DUF1080 domain-containing protein [Verrucomicrobiaceae bacterium R5-34]|uniref:DUF1080 domain-containing protein n=1 Tax=Oceaniferula flava TaxID=2800421 RepID=A0AAE2SEQ4_9BACT|nr:DUF1080 domain-containing protein [Oceaniferula flavus]MBK1831369.1 DUF1080 domain-containing protein [Verrucomicrobiaceae bacterium R5-34]MBK1854961.1 DUF1080 domain-containing protein [Oceaniferula flavus]MBM1136267.1 DUF1080 domain-containing protein [Oceaniferula flavus]
MKTCLTFLAAVTLASPLFAAPAAETATGWTTLFNGKTLKGWNRINGTANYVVKDGTIVGTTSKGSPNSFLCTDKKYSDFELEYEIKIHDKRLNSGVQFRSKHFGGRVEGRVNGPQCEAENTEIKGGGESGYIFAEATKYYWLVPNDKRTPHKHFKDGEWNHFRIKAVGPRIQTWVNGELVCDLTNEEFYKEYPKGYIALQVHSVGNNGPFSVSWKNIRIREMGKSN